MSKPVMKCLRCDTVTRNFPKQENQSTCGDCLKELHAMHSDNDHQARETGKPYIRTMAVT